MLKTIHVLGWAEGVQPKRFRLHGRMAEIGQTLTAVERSTQFFTPITCCFSLPLVFALANCAWFEAHSALQAESQQHGLSRALDLEFSNPESWPSCGLDASMDWFAGWELSFQGDMLQQVSWFGEGRVPLSYSLLPWSIQWNGQSIPKGDALEGTKNIKTMDLKFEHSKDCTKVLYRPGWSNYPFCKHQTSSNHATKFAKFEWPLVVHSLLGAPWSTQQLNEIAKVIRNCQLIGVFYQVCHHINNTNFVSRKSRVAFWLLHSRWKQGPSGLL